MERSRIFPGFVGIVLCLLVFGAAPAHALVSDVLFGGVGRIYVDSNWSGQIDVDSDAYFSAIYDDETFVLILEGHRGLLPAAGSGYALVFQLSGEPGGDIHATEVRGAYVNGQIYRDMNIYNGLPPLVLTFGMREGSATFNFGSSVLGDALPWSDYNLEGILQDVDGDINGDWDSFFVPAHWGDQRDFGAPEIPAATYDIETGWRRYWQDIGAGNQLFFQISAVFWFQGNPWAQYMRMYVPVDANEALTVDAGAETLVGIPRKPSTWVDPGQPGFVGKPMPDPMRGVPLDDEVPPATYSKDTDLVDKFCFVRTAENNRGGLYDFHVQVARKFTSSPVYPAAALILLFLALAGGVRIMRRKGLGKDL